ncbi:hypothetical protein EJ066_24790 [Mesorhizobium sp. M9A.F.Ca.ET.002.03.1.2]|uniref:hypothetical protein n=1 Tax=Mesorhizobium sp. M9A.F.Ca.ET.002.03.1.2 TaxID=2493668 RepID=UPI000F75A41D|nr:hypothetical protein [Mesorhizobium sp. M9A.F.Ca.ET.002.03.1.2]AZO00083.1 hypothetical protein EJ066_24790 [Mesorhizobium sp. M9A.F.Ca.ET.002.03.1.2]
MSKLLAPGFEGDSELTFALQSEFHKGFPLENLRPLLTSDNLHTQAAAAYLVAEISPRLSFNMNCVVAEIADLLDSKIVRIRFDAIEALLGCTTGADGAILGRVMLKLDDECLGVRWKVAQFIRLAAGWQLRLAVENAATLRPDSAFAILAKAHGRENLKATTHTVQWLLDHPNPLVRRFGASVATRPRYVLDEQFLAMAEASHDVEVREIAATCRRRGPPE